LAFFRLLSPHFDLPAWLLRELLIHPFFALDFSVLRLSILLKL
jgi:hypothetical protein